MTNIKNLFAVSAAMAALVASQSVFAQDDLDNLLKDLESEASAKKPAAKAETAEASEPAVETASAPAATETATDQTAEEEKKTEEQPVAEEKPAEEKKVEESVATVNELAAEVKEEKKPVEQ